ncbi:MAG: lysophospholipid acyltransferase family protein [Campylobacteraceae bacterium]
MKQKLEYFIVLFFIKIVKIMPISFTYKTMHFFGNIFYLLLKKRRELAEENLSLAFSEKSKDEIKKLAHGNFIAISTTIAEILLLISKKIKFEDFIEDEKSALETYLNAAKNKKEGQGIIFITAHFSNWEILANYFAIKGFPMTIIGREGDNTFIEEKLTTPFREQFGNKNVHKGSAMTSMVKTLKSGGRVGILIDQKAGTQNSAKTTFFGRECTTTISVATMKLKYDSLIIPAFALREKNKKFSFIIQEPVEYVADEYENKQDKVRAMTQKYNDIFEEVVKKYPEQWFWMHNRWKKY